VGSLIIVLFILLFLPRDLFAWGPATHISLGLDLLNNFRNIVPLASAIASYPYDFLYGTISADVIFWKNRMSYAKHCHNWQLAFSLLKKAGNKAQHSFVWGYILHLAGDTVAHNLYVPEMVLKTYPGKKRHHILWEISFERMIDKSVRDVIRIIPDNIDRGNDDILENNLNRPFFSFRTNKRIFSSIMLLQRIARWNKRYRYFRNGLNVSEFNYYYNLSLNAMMSVLKMKEKSPVVESDPTGRHILKLSSNLRKIIQNNGNGDVSRLKDIFLKTIREYNSSILSM